MKNRAGYLIGLFGLILLSFKVIKNPEPVFKDPVPVKLKIVKEVSQLPEGKPDFIVKISSIAPDFQGKIYVADTGAKRILIFDEELNFLRGFGKKGEGPREFRKGLMVFIRVIVGKDGKIYVSEIPFGRILVFDPSGKFLRVFRLGTNSVWGLAVDEKGNFYMPSQHEGLVDIYSPEMKYVTSLFPRDFLKESLFISHESKRRRVRPSFENIKILLHGKKVLALNKYSCRVIVKDKQATGYFLKALWTPNMLRKVKEEFRKLERIKQETKIPNNVEITYLACGGGLLEVAFSDERGRLYIQKERLIFEFDLEKGLQAEYSLPLDAIIMAKYKENFYGFYHDENDDNTKLILLRRGGNEKNG